MKKITKTIIASCVILVGTFAVGFFSPSAHSNSTGAPQGRTGSPGDGVSCANGSGCHTGNGNPTAASNMIFTNVPTAGYTPGATYTIIATAAAAVSIIPQKYGFEISPQNATGAQKGTLVVTNSTETQLVGGTKYITHKQAGTSPPIAGQKSWTFDWIAPVAGTGDVTFYGAFVFANGTGNSSGDFVFTTSTLVKENTVGVEEIGYSNVNNWNVFPNPSNDKITVESIIKSDKEVKFELIDISGKKVKEISEINILNNNTIDINDLSNGIYTLSIYTDERVVNKKVIKK